MVKKAKKLLLILICLLLSFASLCSCGDHKETQKIQKSSSISLDYQVKNQTLYKKRTVNSNIKVQFYRISRGGERIFLCGKENNGINVFYNLNVDTCELEKINYSTSAYVAAISPDSEALLILEYDIQESETNAEPQYRLVEVDTNGKKLMELELEQGTISLATGMLASEDHIILSSANSVTVLNRDGKVIESFDYSGENPRTVSDADNAVLICTQTADGYSIAELSNDCTEIVNKYMLDSNFKFVYGGYGSLGVYLSDGNKIYSVDYRHGTAQEVLDLILNNISISSITPLNSKAWISLRRGDVEIWEPRGIEEEIVILRLATYNIGYMLSDAILDFNSWSDKYKITVTDYAQYNAGSRDGLTVLNTEITAGNIPDIFDLTTLPGRIYSERGLLRDLNGYIRDSGMSDNFVEPARKCLSDSEGHLNEITPGFRLTILAGSDGTLPDKCTWTTQEFIQFTKQHENKGRIFPSNITKEDFLAYILAFSGDSFVDYDLCTCSFDSDDFCALLEFASSLESESDLDGSVDYISESYRDLINGIQILRVFDLCNPVSDIVINDALFHGKGRFIGFPTKDGTGCGMTPVMRLGMSAIGEHGDGAWEFFSFLLSDEYQSKVANQQRSIPIIQSALDKYISEEIERQAEQPVKFAFFPDGEETVVECSEPNIGIKEQIFELIDSMDCINEYDYNIYTIVINEASAYFSGQRSVQDTANLIQSKVQLYLGEQYS